MIKAIEDIRIKPVSWLKAGAYACVLALVYYSTFVRLVTYDWAKEDYSHCMLVPFVVLYLLWEKRREIAATPSRAVMDRTRTFWHWCAPFLPR